MNWRGRPLASHEVIEELAAVPPLTDALFQLPDETTTRLPSTAAGS
jgi:hypothetical protein